MTTDDVTDRWWLPHFVALWVWCLLAGMMIVAAVAALLGLPDQYAGVAMLPFMLVAIPAAIYSGLWGLVSYYKENKAMKQAGLEWRPKLWPLWTIMHLIFTPYFLSPVYLWWRRRKLGRPTNRQLKSHIPFVDTQKEAAATQSNAD
jgi:hypothetical protein